MKSKNSKISEPHRFNLIDKLNLKNPKKNMALANLSIYYTWKNIRSAYNINKFKVSALTWSDTFDWWFKFMWTRLKTIVLNIKMEYKLELLTPETMKWLGSTKKL